MNKVLVTGANGFVGSHLVSKLRTTGYEVICVTRNSGEISEEATWRQIPPTNIVVHLAAKTFVPDSWSDSYSFIKTNVLGTVAALNYCKLHHARLVLVSSYLYGNPKRLPISETEPIDPTNPYALSKKLAEESCAFYASKQGVRSIIIRPFNVYGPRQNSSFLIPKLISQIRRGKSIEVTDLEPKRDYVFVDDFTDAILRAMVAPTHFDIINIGSGKSYSVLEIIELLQQISRSDLPVFSSEKRRKDELMDTIANITKAKDILGWEPRYSIKAGLEKTFTAYTNNQ